MFVSEPVRFNTTTFLTEAHDAKASSTVDLSGISDPRLYEPS
jgi:hypothetical protein